MRKRLVLGCFLLLSLPIAAKIVFPTVMADNMVLQQNEQVNLWGKASPNATVNVVPAWDHKTYTTVADKAGKWIVKVQTPSAGGPYDIAFSDGEKVTLKNILIGEVWFCSQRDRKSVV